MDSSELAELTEEINEKTSTIRKMLELRTVAKDQDKQNILLKIGQDISAINGLLDQFETQVCQQRDMLKYFKEIEEFFQVDLRDTQQLRDNVPPHMPKKGSQAEKEKDFSPCVSGAKDQDQAQNQNPLKKPPSNQIREMMYITAEEFESIPQYMKGRVAYNQLNAVVQNINTAVKEKYSILQKPAKSLNNVTHMLHQRFKEQDTKDTKGHFFVVEADIREFTQIKVDKRFHGMLNMLRHCHRLRQLRGGGLTRYILL
ncbi:hypothetical protein AAFF_G00252460 [Aldrovandia affinis]|uniref:SKA complex subunit 1 n=1 Tax=Aldrovandia affinis TaxID=143900 RepID=A0AAD7WT92_9TELE|nr:hypothetical protein AAFF_G00252460 [Aldrovandia affinis]